MLEKIFWFMDENILWVHIINFIVSIAILLIPSKILAIMAIVLLTPIWICEVISLIYGVVKGYFG